MELLWEDHNIPGWINEIEQDKPQLDVYLADASSDQKPAVIICAGGGYSRRAAHEGEPVAQWLNTIGISAFVVRYRVAPYRYPYPIMDAKRAIRYVRYYAERFCVNPNQIGILGFSAGGHLASTIGTHIDEGDPNALDPIDRLSARPDALILCYPVITFGTYRHQGSIKNLLGKEAVVSQMEALSNELHVSEKTPPTFLWHTANDQTVKVENSILFAQALSRKQIPYELHIFPDGKHGLGLATEHPHVSIWTELCKRWFADMNWIDASSSTHL